MMGNVKYCGRNKLKYVTYRCGNRDRTKECRNKELRRFNDAAIPHLVRQLNEYQQTATAVRSEEVLALQAKLVEVDRQIGNIVSAVTKGMTHASFTGKSDRP